MQLFENGLRMYRYVIKAEREREKGEGEAQNGLNKAFLC